MSLDTGVVTQSTKKAAGTPRPLARPLSSQARARPAPFGTGRRSAGSQGHRGTLRLPFAASIRPIASVSEKSYARRQVAAGRAAARLGGGTGEAG